jgi:hypothetical protein
MAPCAWSEGTSRDEWLHSWGPQYEESVLAKMKVAFLEQLYPDWFSKYHWSLTDQEEVDLDAQYTEPVDEANILQKHKIIMAKKVVAKCIIFQHENFF